MSCTRSCKRGCGWPRRKSWSRPRKRCYQKANNIYGVYDTSCPPGAPPGPPSSTRQRWPGGAVGCLCAHCQLAALKSRDGRMGHLGMMGSDRMFSRENGSLNGFERQPTTATASPRKYSPPAAAPACDVHTRTEPPGDGPSAVARRPSPGGRPAAATSAHHSMLAHRSLLRLPSASLLAAGRRSRPASCPPTAATANQLGQNVPRRTFLFGGADVPLVADRVGAPANRSA